MKEWIALNLTPGVGPRVAAKLLERFGSAERIFSALRSELEPLRLKPETLESILFRDQMERAAEEIERVRAAGAEILVLDDGVYPALLREIYDPPPVLYVKGAWEICFEQPCVAFVGSRRASTYGQNAAEMLARDLASRGVTIVSGLARGIDAAAHRGALAAGRRTVGVLGTGIDQVYPRDHAKLTAQILEQGGALVTQFPLETPPMPEHFPFRNRIISGLSYGTVVVEAAENSGSLITARLALEQNREVFAVPGNITSRTSFGANYLIKSAGAKLVQQWQDIITELPNDIAAALLPPEPSKKKRGMTNTATELLPAPTDLTDAAQRVLKRILPDEAVPIDALAIMCELPISQLAGVLLELEMRDLIRELPGKCFVRKL